MRRFLRRASEFAQWGARLPALCTVLFLSHSTPARAADVTSVFVPPSAPILAGSQAGLWLYSLNNSSQKVVQTFKTSLICTLISGSSSSNIVLALNPDTNGMTALIPPGGFIKQEYLFTVPSTFSGRVRAEISEYNQVVQLEVSAAGPVAPRSTETAQAAKGVSITEKKTTTLTQVISNNIFNALSFYEPTYFILGSYPAAEFQFSIKYKVLNYEGPRNPFAHLYFAYTQTSFWDLISPDPSFYDTSYKPSVFLLYPDVLDQKIGEKFHLDLQGGTEHESNGRGGTGERSLYTVYLQPTATFDLPLNLKLALQPRIRDYYWVGHNNPDIADYRGYADLLGSLTWKDPQSDEKIQFATKFRIGDEGSHPGLQFDLRFNLAFVSLLSNFNPTIQVQYFTGYGQTLRQYNQTSHAIRAGLCLTY